MRRNPNAKPSKKGNPRGSEPGFLLVDSDLNPIYANREAIRILTYPEDPRKMKSRLLENCVEEKVRSILAEQLSRLSSALPSAFLSGKRRYLCRAFSVDFVANRSSTSAISLLIERSHQISLDFAHIGELYRLTPRERQILRWLVRGLTSKEIGNQMKISPNTVKAFLRLVMLKMGVTTRTGIMGKIVENGLSPQKS